jgi:5-methylthioadenosine/S-adenosylhomocysteine deaminase
LQRAITGGTVVTCDDQGRVFPDGVVAWRDARLVYVGPRAGYAPTGDEEWLDAPGHLVLPGLVNLHTHTTMTALRGLIDDVPAPAWLPRAQELESRLSLEDRYWSSLAGACELLRAGVTCVADRGAGMSRCAQALWDSGIRAVVAHTVTDEGGESSWRESEAVLDQWGVTGTRRIFAGLGPHATDTCGDRLLARVRDRARELGALTFIHVAQSRDEVAAAKKRGDAGCVHLLHRLGLLAPTLVAAHCTYLEPGEVELLASTGTRVAHCPVANAKLEGAVASGWRFWRDGIAVGLGTDSAASNNAMDPWFDLKFAALFHKTAAANPEALPARTAVEWFTRTAAACLGMADQIGSLRPGARADIITLRTDVPRAVPLPDPWSHLAYSAAGGDVEMVVVDGRPVMRGGSFPHIDRERVIRELGRIRAKLLV